MYANGSGVKRTVNHWITITGQRSMFDIWSIWVTVNSGNNEVLDKHPESAFKATALFAVHKEIAITITYETVAR